jgi:enamine deaminase RidA (YjgF/YER057c/UK114 family)
VNSYHVPLSKQALSIMTKELKKWTPNHNPIWTCVEVQKLEEEDAKVEIEVVAHDPQVEEDGVKGKVKGEKGKKK